MSRILALLVLSLCACKHEQVPETLSAPAFSCMTGWKDLSDQVFPDPEPGSVNEIDHFAIYDMWPDGEPLHSYKCPLHNGHPDKKMCCDQGLLVTW